MTETTIPTPSSPLSLRLALALAAAGATLFAAGCQQDSQVDKEMLAKLEAIDQGIVKLNAAFAAGGAAARSGAAAPGAAAQPPAKPRAPTPDPTVTFAVPVGTAPVEGNSDALVTIVKAYEYACPFCEKARPTAEQIKKEYGDDVRIVYKQYVVHPQVATDAALGACAAGRQKKFSAMDALLWEKAYKTRTFDRANIEAIGQEAGLDLARMKADMDGPCKEIVQKEQAEMSAVGARSTPAFYINGRYLPGGAVPFDKFKAVIDEELAKARARVGQGTKASAYYDEWVIGKGVKKFEPKAAAAAAPTPTPTPAARPL